MVRKTKHRQKLMEVILLFLFSSTCLPLSSPNVTAKEPKLQGEKAGLEGPTQTYELSEIQDNLRIFGRQNKDSDDIWLHHPANGISFEAECEGTVSLKAKILFNADYPTLYFTVYVDGVRQGSSRGQSLAIKNNGQSEYFITLAQNLRLGKHKFEFYRQNETGMGRVQLQAVQLNGKILPQKWKHPRIEFIGDSITAGYGVYTDGNYSVTDSYYGDATNAYAFQTARALDADFNTLAVSGYGLIAGWGKEQNMVKMFPFTNWFLDRSEHGLHPFEEQPVDIVCVNLGTNDWNVRGSTETDILVEPDMFYNGVIHFTKLIRQYYPHAKIVWLYGMILGKNPFDSQIISATEYLGGEANGIYHHRLPSGVSGLIGHPDVAEQMRAADVLKEFLTQILPDPIRLRQEQEGLASDTSPSTSQITIKENPTQAESHAEDDRFVKTQAFPKKLRFFLLCSILVLIAVAGFSLFKLLNPTGR